MFEAFLTKDTLGRFQSGGIETQDTVTYQFWNVLKSNIDYLEHELEPEINFAQKELDNEEQLQNKDDFELEELKDEDVEHDQVEHDTD